MYARARVSVPTDQAEPPADVNTLWSKMYVTPELVQQPPKGSFASNLRGLTVKVVPILFPFFELENLPRTTKEERAAIL